MDIVVAALSKEISNGKTSSTPSKKAKIDSLLSLIQGVDNAALLRTVSTQLKTNHLLASDTRSNSSLELSMDTDFPSKLQRTSSSGGLTNDFSKYPSTPSGKIAGAAAGLSSTAKVKKLFASASFASSLAAASTTAANSDAPKTSAGSVSVIASSSASSAPAVQPLSAVKKSRTPLKTLPLNIQNQITALTAKTKLNSVSSSVGTKWMKPVTAAPVNDMRSAMEERLGNMR